MKKIAISICVLIIGIIIGYLIPKQSPTRVNETIVERVDVVVENAVLPQPSIISGDAIIKEKRMVDIKGGIAYEIVLLIPEIKKSTTLDVNITEYKILAKKDQVPILYSLDTTTETLTFLDWKRDSEGKIQIMDNRPIVVIDPGHGGKDQGQGSNQLWSEKDLNLKMSYFMKTQLEKSGIRVILTRDSEGYLSLYDRSLVANYIEADLFISNHLNKYNEEASGIEIIYSNKSDSAFAMSMAKALESEDYNIFKVHNRKHDYLEGEDYYFLHRYIDIPSYIIEYGFADLEYDTYYIAKNWMTMVGDLSDEIVAYLETE